MIKALCQANPEVPFIEIRIIKTSADIRVNTPFTGFSDKGFFVKEIETALLSREIDLAVHSLKDMPSEPTPGLVIGAVPEREDPRDVLVTRHRCTLVELPMHARVGTGSPRRGAQLRAFRPDFEIVLLRGNVETRVRRTLGGELDAVVLAAAGLSRLGREKDISEVIGIDICVPAVGQGALAVQVREDDAETRRLVAPLDHEPARLAVTAERAFMRTLGGGCQVPFAAWGEVEGDKLTVRGVIASPDGARLFRDRIEGEAAQAEALGQALAEKMLRSGADELVGSGLNGR